MSSALLIGVCFFCVYQWKKRLNPNKMTRLDGKVVIVTGATSKIGVESAIELARRGAKVYLACKNRFKGDMTLAQVISASANPNVILCGLDLASFDSIRKFAKLFLQKERRLDVLINNPEPFDFGENELTLEMGLNHFGHFLLTKLLLDLMKVKCWSKDFS